MAYQSAAVVVLDHEPDADELEDIAVYHLEDFDADEAHASVDVTREAPEWLSVCERDQVNAHLRDGGRNAVVVVIYLGAGGLDDEDEDDYGE